MLDKFGNFGELVNDRSIVDIETKVIDLGNKAYTDADIEHIVHSTKERLKSPKKRLSVVEINLKNNKIQQIETVIHLLGICNLSNLKKLDISHNEIDLAHNAPHFAMQLAGSGLEELDLGNNQIGDDAAKEFFVNFSVFSSSSVSTPFKLASINISHNRLSNLNTWINTLMVVMAYPHIKEIIFDHNAFKITSHSIENLGNKSKLLKAIKESKIEHVGIEHCGLPAEFEKEIKQTLLSKTLEHDPLQRDTHYYPDPLSATLRNEIFHEKSPLLQSQNSQHHVIDCQSGFKVNESTENDSPKDMENGVRRIRNDPSQSLTGTAFFFNQFKEGAKPILKTANPLALASLLAYDIYQFYQYPQYRYNDTLLTILTGLSTSRHHLSTNFGGYLPTDYKTWAGLGLILTAPLAAGLSQWLRNNSWRKPLTQKAYADLINDLVHPSNFSNRSISRAAWAILYDQDLDDSQQITLATHLANLNHPQQFFTQLASLGALHQLADQIKSRHLSTLRLQSNIHLKTFTHIRGIALTALQDTAKNNMRNPPARFLHSLPANVYANYLAWSLGNSQSTPWSFLFNSASLIYYPFLAYSAARFIESLVFKLQNLYQFFVQKNNCEADHKTWAYMKQIQDYACSICGDLDHIYYKNVFSSQGCLDGFLAYPQIPQNIIQLLNRLENHPGLKSLDFSNQNSSSWTIDEFQSVLNSVKLAFHDEMALFNLSSATPDLIWVQDSKADILANFISQQAITQIDVGNLSLGDQKATTLLESINTNSPTNNTATNYIDFSSNNVTDQIIMPLGQRIQSKLIYTVKLANNQITSLGIVQLKRYLLTSAVDHLDISGNAIDQMGVDTLAEIITQTPSLRVLDLSNMDLSEIDFTRLGQALSKSCVKVLYLRSTSISDAQIQQLAPAFATLESADLSDNAIGDTGAIYLFSSAQHGALKHVNLSGNIVGDIGMEVAGRILPATAIESFDISSNSFTVNGFRQFMKNSTTSALRSINVANNFLGNAAADIVVASMNSLIQINLSNNLIDDDGGIPIINKLPDSIVQKLNMSNNLLTSKSLIAAAGIIHKTQLTDFDVSYNSIDLIGAQVFAPSLPHSLLTKFSLSGNPIKPKGARAIAENLITKIPNMDELADSTISADESLALEQANANTPLTDLGLRNVEMDTETAMMLCTELPQTLISINNIQLDQNPINSGIVDTQSCDISPGNKVQPAAIYRGLSFAYQSVKQTAHYYWGRITEDRSVKTPGVIQANNIAQKTDVFVNSHHDNPHQMVAQSLSENQTIEDHQTHNVHWGSPLSSSYPGMNTTLMLGYVAAKTVSAYLPNLPKIPLPSPSQELHKMDQTEQDLLQYYKKKLNVLNKNYHPQKTSHARDEDYLKNQFDVLDKLFKEIKKLIENTENSGNISHSILDHISVQLEQIEKNIHQLSAQNKQLKKSAVKENRIMERIKNNNERAVVITHVKNNKFAKREIINDSTPMMDAIEKHEQACTLEYPDTTFSRLQKMWVPMPRDAWRKLEKQEDNMDDVKPGMAHINKPQKY